MNSFLAAEHASRTQLLESNLQALTEDCRLLELHNRDLRNTASLEVSELQRRHQDELAAIDTRIRALLRGKDEAIASLQRRVLEAEETSIEMENLLKDINIK